MREWIVIAVLYLLMLLVLRFLGGFAGAGEALRRWGEASSARWSRTGSSRTSSSN